MAGKANEINSKIWLVIIKENVIFFLLLNFHIEKVDKVGRKVGRIDR